MPKKRTPKKRGKTPKKTSSRKSRKPESLEIKLPELLTQNFVSLQKVMVKLTSNLETLNTRINKLLDLFETSAKTLAEEDLKLREEALKISELPRPPKPAEQVKPLKPAAPSLKPPVKPSLKTPSPEQGRLSIKPVTQLNPPSNEYKKSGE